MSSTTWRISRVDRTRALAVPEHGEAADGGARSPLALPLRPGGVLPAVVGDDVVPAVGDRVLVEEHDGGAPLPHDVSPVARLAPRTSELVRDTVDRTSHQQVVAANVEVVVVVEPLDPEPSIGRIERLVTLAWRSGATPVVVLTKADLAHDAEDWAADVEAVAPGVRVLAVSAATGAGMPQLAEVVTDGATLVVVGPSGAGKSTLVNAAAGAEVMATGERRGDGKGRHTTTHRELVPLALPDGGAAWLVDTPGLRAVGLVADVDAVEHTFAEVADLAAQCRFGDCSHAGEPGCEVAAALEDGRLTERRYASYRAQLREAAWAARRSDARLAAQEGREWRRRTVEMRQHHRITGKGRR